jgi:RNA polymerase sigma-70 factor (ECF subfamily)
MPRSKAVSDVASVERRYSELIMGRDHRPPTGDSPNGEPPRDPPGHDSELSRQEFERLYEQLVGPVFGYLARRVGRDLAEELASQAFVEAWAGRNRYRADRGSPAGWIWGIVTNLLRRHRRSEVRQLRAYARTGSDPLATSTGEQEVVGRVDAARLMPKVARALADMRDEDRDVLLLYAYAGLGYQQIAEALGISVGTVKSRLSRARARLVAITGVVLDTEVDE